jgi:hypothetical protein
MALTPIPMAISVTSDTGTVHMAIINQESVDESSKHS